jgi:hypothetical protein
MRRAHWHRPHVMVQHFMMLIGANTVFIPYKGGAPLITDLLSGQVQMTFGAKSAFLPQVQAGKTTSSCSHERAPLARTPRCADHLKADLKTSQVSMVRITRTRWYPYDRDRQNQRRSPAGNCIFGGSIDLRQAGPRAEIAASGRALRHPNEGSHAVGCSRQVDRH